MKQYWIVGGEFTSLNFHSFLPETTSVFGPYKTREVAETVWKDVSEQMRHKASYRYIILEDSMKG